MLDHYADPVAKLLTYGKFDWRHSDDPWPDYTALGLTAEHVPELVRMASDTVLHGAPQDSLEVWAPLHAWRALGQLRAVEAVPDLVRHFEWIDYDDWLVEDIPHVFSLIGPSSIPALADYLSEENASENGRSVVPECLKQIAQDHTEAREECVRVMSTQLEKHASNGEELNGFLICGLIDLDGTEAMDVIRAAFAQDHVDLSIVGDLEEVEISLGLRAHRSTPRPHFTRAIPGLDALLANRDPDLVFPDLPSGAPVRRGPKTGRNEPCPCGSGRKFKKCCLHAGEVQH